MDFNTKYDSEETLQIAFSQTVNENNLIIHTFYYNTQATICRAKKHLLTIPHMKTTK